MPTIINELEYVFTPAELQEINNAAKSADANIVYTQQGAASNHFHFYADDDFSNYLFSIDTDADGSCVIWEKA